MAKRRQDYSSLDLEEISLAEALGFKLESSPGTKEDAKTSLPDKPGASGLKQDCSINLKAPLRISLERKGHGGKTVTKLLGLEGSKDRLQSFVKELKQGLGCGASVQDDVILLQGDQRERLKDLLISRGASNVKSS